MSAAGHGVSPAIAAELFPILPNRVPKLRAFSILTADSSPAVAGGRLSYRLKSRLGGVWVWSISHIITDSSTSEESVQACLQELWKSQSTIFGDVRGVREDPAWNQDQNSASDFVANGIAREFGSELKARLPARTDLGSVWADRVYDVRGWVVDQRPAISISVASRLSHKESLETFARKLPSPEELVGLFVYDRSSTLKGEVEEVVGSLKDHRERLLGLASRPEMIELLSNAPDDEPVVRVSTGRLGYDYAVSALGLIVRSSDYVRFGVNSRRALSILKIAPAARWSIVLAVAGPLQEAGWIGEPLRSDGASGEVLYRSARMAGLALRFGSGTTLSYDSKTLLSSMKRHGLLRVAERFTAAPVRIAVMDATGSHALGPFLEKLSSQIRDLGVSCDIGVLPSSRDTSRAGIEGAVDGFDQSRFDVLLAVFPDQKPTPDDEEADDSSDGGSYQNLKSLTVGRGIPSQFVLEGTLSKPFAVANVVLGILGKTGNIPFALGRPLKGIDLVVGLDIARLRKTRLPGSINATAIARIYLGDGEFLRYVIHDAPIEGETIPEGVLQSLFPRRDFDGKHVVIHRDGFFRGGEREALQRWARDIGARFHLVEVIKSGSPRIYAMSGGRIVMPDKGMMVRLSPREALLVSTPPPFADATPNPLRVRTDGTIDLDDAIESVLALTLLHYGSLRPPRLPVTVHYSDKIAYLALRGIKPKQLEGSVPFWL